VHVLLLRHLGHGKVLVDQELDQLAVFIGKTVPLGEVAGVRRAQM
jgi:hypothetical protein